MGIRSSGYLGLQGYPDAGSSYVGEKGSKVQFCVQKLSVIWITVFSKKKLDLVGVVISFL